MAEPTPPGWWETLSAPPDFGEVVLQAAGPLHDDALRSLVHQDARQLGSLFMLVPTISRYATVIDPASHPLAAREVVEQVLAAAGPSRDEVARLLAARHAAWRTLIERACVTDDLLPHGPEEPDIPRETGAAGPDGVPQFEIGEPLSRGSQGLVMTAIDRAATDTRGQGVVVKFLACADGADATWRSEAARAAAVTRSCGVRVLDAGRAGPTLAWIAMERVDGMPLTAVAAAEAWPASWRIAAELAQIALALAELHAEGLHHGDITPANVILDRHGRLRLVDFGRTHADPAQAAAQDVRQLACLAEWIAVGHLAASARRARSLPTQAMALRIRPYQHATEGARRLAAELTGFVQAIQAVRIGAITAAAVTILLLLARWTGRGMH